MSALALKLEALTVDVGGTLIEAYPSVGHVYAEVASRHGVRQVTPELLNQRFVESWRSRQEFHHSRAAWEALVDQVFSGLSSTPPSQSFFGDLYEQFTKAERWRVLPDVVPALEALASSGVRMAVVSNWDERLRMVLKAVRLHDYFETIIASHDIGFTKPSTVIFEQAAKKLGVPPDMILHVGDHPREDVDGAHAAGFQALLLDRKSSPIPFQRIASLDAVLAYFHSV